MKQIFKTYAVGIVTVVSVAAIIVVSLIAKDTQYENAFIYLTGLSIVLITFAEIYSKKK